MALSFGDLLSVALFVYLSYVAVLILYRLTLHPLSGYPGPKIAAATSLYEFLYDVRGGLYYQKIEEMHTLYGPIVRVTPGELHVKDSAFFTTLHANSPARRDKHSTTADIVGLVPTTFSTKEHDLHKRRKAAVSPLFYKKSINRSCDIITQQLDLLSYNLQQSHSCEETVNLHRTLLAFTSDTVATFTIGFSTELQKSPRKAQQWESALYSLIEMTPLVKNFPRLIDMSLKLPESLLALSPKLAAVIHWRKGFLAAADHEVHVNRKHEYDSDVQKTLFQAIRTSDLPPSEMSSERMGIEAEAVATAGAETTATALTQAIYLLLAHPSSLDRLRKELLPVYPDPNRKSNLASLRELPYLVGFIPPHAAVVGGSLILGEKTAVIKETLRISPNITSRLPLLSHTELQYGKWRIPAMTPVSTSIVDVHFDPVSFPEPNHFLPDRWLTAEGKKSSQYDKFFVPFGRGHRMCLGYELAYAELYLGLATIVRKFDLELFDTDWERDIKIKRDCFLGLPGPESRGVRVKVTGLRE